MPKQHCEQCAALPGRSGPNLTGDSRRNLLLVWCFWMDMKEVAMSPFHLSPQTDFKFYRCASGLLLATLTLGKVPSPRSSSTCALKIQTGMSRGWKEASMHWKWIVLSGGRSNEKIRRSSLAGEPLMTRRAKDRNPVGHLVDRCVKIGSRTSPSAPRVHLVSLLLKCVLLLALCGSLDRSKEHWRATMQAQPINPYVIWGQERREAEGDVAESDFHGGEPSAASQHVFWLLVYNWSKSGWLFVSPPAVDRRTLFCTPETFFGWLLPATAHIAVC